MTPASEALWKQHLLPAKTAGIIIKSLGLHDASLAENLIKKFTTEETAFIDQLLKSKNIQKALKEVKSLLDGYIKKISQQANNACMQLSTGRTFNSHAWRYAAVRTTNILRLADNQPLYVPVSVTMPRSEGINLLLSLPDEIHANPESLSPEMKEVAVNQNSEGKFTRISNKPINYMSPATNEEKMTLTLLVTEPETKEFIPSGTTYDAVFDPETGSYNVRIEGTDNNIKISASRFTRLKKSAISILKAETHYAVASASVGVLFAFYAFGEALVKQDKTSKDWVNLTSSFLGVIKNGSTWRDAVETSGNTEEEIKALIKAKKLVLWGETPWLTGISHSINVLAILNTLYDFDQAIKTQRDGEPARAVTAAYTSSALTAIATVFLFKPLPYGIGQIVGVLCIILGALISWWGAQVLTLEQRMWFHRCIFGLPGRYYDAEHFGGQPPALHASEQVCLQYHQNALNDEQLALSMLVQGVKLEIAYFELYSPAVIKRNASKVVHLLSTENNEADTTTTVNLKITVPVTLDCIIQLAIDIKSIKKEGELGHSDSILRTYTKTGSEIANYQSPEIHQSKEKEPVHHIDGEMMIIELEQKVTLDKHYPITLSIFDKKAIYHVIAKDVYVINAAH